VLDGDPAPPRKRDTAAPNVRPRFPLAWSPIPSQQLLRSGCSSFSALVHPTTISIPNNGGVWHTQPTFVDMPDCDFAFDVIMVALCNRADHYIFALLFLSSIFFYLLFIPRLISAAAGWMSTIL